MSGKYSDALRAMGEALASGDWPDPRDVENFKSAMESAVFMAEGYLSEQLDCNIELSPDLSFGWDLFHPGPGFNMADLRIVPCLNPEICPLDRLPAEVADRYRGREAEFFEGVNSYIRERIGCRLLQHQHIQVVGKDGEQFSVDLSKQENQG